MNIGSGKKILAQLLHMLCNLQKLSEEYTTFSGSEGMLPGSVRFIVRTDAIDP